ncbi:hypothetical protein [Rhodopila sp.]|uniref:hypothetical protein n=1 Tax=Rhodopila sp. TaxID=2480087 RepID=UPI003D0E0508
MIVFIARHQRFVDVHCDIARGDGRRRHLIEGVDVRFLSEHKIASDMRAFERFSARWMSSGGEHRNKAKLGETSTMHAIRTPRGWSESSRSRIFTACHSA